jgi:hypothetical protein
MSHSRNRFELAEEIAKSDLPADCAGCTATKNCVIAAATEGGRTDIAGGYQVVESWMRSYTAGVAGCIGPEACLGAILREEPVDAMVPAAPAPSALLNEL